MLAPDECFMVHSSEVPEEHGGAHRASKIASVTPGNETPEWRLRDFAFAAWSSSASSVSGFREIQLGRRSIRVLADPRENCEEIVVFRRGTDTRRKWDEDSITDAKVGLDAFFVMRAKQITSETPLSKQFNGEWGFWESFFVPLIDEEQTMQSLSLLDHAMCEERFARRRLSVSMHSRQGAAQVLTVPDDLVVQHDVRLACKDIDTWANLCSKIGEDMLLTEACIVEHKHLKPGDECIEAFHEVLGQQDHIACLRKRDLELLKLPVVIKFRCTMHVAKDWRPDQISLQYKFDMFSTIYNSNLMGGFNSMSGARADPWSPMGRLAVNALTKVIARFPDIRTVLDAGCGDMAWMQHFLKDHPLFNYVGVDIMPYCLAVNFRRFPRSQFIQTDLSNLSGIEVLPQGVDLVIAKDLMNHMVLPDAIGALRRIVATRPRFLLTHVDTASDNTGWEKRIDLHLHYTRYDYNKPPFCLPYPVVEIQRISESQCFVLYEITPEGATTTPAPKIERLRVPELSQNVDAYLLLEHGDLVTPCSQVSTLEDSPPRETHDVPTLSADELGPRPVAAERTMLTTAVTDLPDKEDNPKPVAERREIKGLSALEFRARCDLIFERFDRDKDRFLNYEELCSLMDAGGRKIEEYDAYCGLCKRLGCDARLGLNQKDTYNLFEKAPQAVWEEVYRSINPAAQLVRRGAEKLQQTALTASISESLFEDTDQFAKVTIEFNSHLFYGAAELISEEHVQVLFGKQILEVFILAPGSFGAKDLYLWKFCVTPLTGEVVPEDCTFTLHKTEGRFGSKKMSIKLMKSKKKKWYKVGQASTGMRV